MTDKQLVINFIERGYNLYPGEKGFIFVEKSNGREMYYNDFFVLVRKIFGDFIGSDGSVSDIFLEWFKQRKAVLIKRLYEYLEGCSIKLGASDWVVLNGKHVVTKESLIKTFGDTYNHKFIEYYFNQWYNDEVLKSSERIMKIF